MMSEDEILHEIEKFGDSKEYENFVKFCIKKDNNLQGAPNFYSELADWYGSIPYNILEGSVLKKDRLLLRTLRKKFHVDHSEHLEDIVYNWCLSQQADPIETPEAVRWCYNLYGKIMTAFENFYDCTELEFYDIPFYERINEMGWGKDARKLRKKFCKKRNNVTQINYGMKLGDEYGNIAYVWRLEKGVDYIMAARASRDMRTEIKREDVLAAWSTYINFIHSDFDEIPLAPVPTREEVMEHVKKLGKVQGVELIEVFHEVDKKKQKMKGE